MLRHAPQLLWLVLLVGAGCGETATGIGLSGTVTRAGKPVEDGSILFVPNAKQGTKGQPVRAEITGGAFRIAAQEGLQAGHYLIEVSLTGTPGRMDVPKIDKPFRREREITGPSAQIDIVL